MGLIDFEFLLMLEDFDMRFMFLYLRIFLILDFIGQWRIMIWKVLENENIFMIVIWVYLCKF